MFNFRRLGEKDYWVKIYWRNFGGKIIIVPKGGIGNLGGG